MADSSTPDALLAEALLWLQWSQGAATGPLLGEAPPEAPWKLAPASRPAQAPRGAPGRPGGTARRRVPTDSAPAARGPAAPVVPTRRAPPMPPEKRPAALATLAEEVAACTRCRLAETRTQTVFGVGAATPRLVIVGEAPGAREDEQGEPFVGPAGALLTKMLGAIGLSRDDVYILNVLKCRPPQNRTPRPDEVGACRPFLHAQLEILDPQLVLALGSPAARELLRTERGIMSLRGRFAKTPLGYRVMPTYHPAYLLRNPAAKREAWQDLKRVAADLGLALPER